MDALIRLVTVILLGSGLMPWAAMADYNFSRTHYQSDSTKVAVTTSHNSKTGDAQGHFLVLSFKGSDSFAHSMIVACDPESSNNTFVMQSSELPQTVATTGAMKVKVDNKKAHTFNSSATSQTTFGQMAALGSGLKFHLIIHELANGSQLKVTSTSNERTVEFDAKLNGLRPAIADFLQRCGLTI